MIDIQILETVTFRLNEGVSDADFMTAARGLDGYLDRCVGLCTRTLSCNNTGLWREDYVWANEAAAKAADAGFMAAPEAQAFMALVSRESVKMSHAKVALHRSVTEMVA
ncbi:hypothetical protein [Celeribacter sp. PS-C1]|uniref:hypothetical protein n=1 Tax=Celeribacter sp. PS-C1 TaxID=2820813 RepID=UPI001CA50D49|nr:hypothetical protein [Celeribacter sp. PS-C1]MBW6418103.1 hypothetical protein [Celeribacter sp. PS-C1]